MSKNETRPDGRPSGWGGLYDELFYLKIKSEKKIKKQRKKK